MGLKEVTLSVTAIPEPTSKSTSVMRRLELEFISNVESNLNLEPAAEFGHCQQAARRRACCSSCRDA
jgi:hypothetical protein